MSSCISNQTVKKGISLFSFFDNSYLPAKIFFPIFLDFFGNRARSIYKIIEEMAATMCVYPQGLGENNIEYVSSVWIYFHDNSFCGVKYFFADGW